nr:immunoglobulin heavy chain junction region [Macaca mulatta]MOV35873.1 immunoglobulin heavy chain junction region [Macaca mulatta]MOV35962.1 immunoglobulin heavy chain junction region [Macaca mulatta]MOV36020.1 immunoglobulin heavy chain junction region [Macaca mulatta]MOV36176.1 immunoglobulin heavy chain junction region [Macaca mulatta]
CTNGDAW